MRWIIQDNIYNEEGHDALLRVLQIMGLPHSVHKIVPFVRTLEPEPTPEPGEKVIVLGAYTMLSIARERGWTPGSYATDDLDFVSLRLHWGAERMLNGDASIMNLGHAVESMFRTPRFLRPTADSKLFSGQVFDWDSFREWRERTRDHVPAHTRIMMCAPKPLYGEYRTWIVDGRVVTASQYRQGSTVLYNPDVPGDILTFAQECADLWSPAPAYVLDVASTPEGLRIVEVNCINAAGWYRGNVGKIVQALEDMESAS